LRTETSSKNWRTA